MPTPNVSVVDLVIQVEKKTLAEEVNEAFRQAAANEMKGILAVSDVPLVSRDFAMLDVSTTIDSSLTMVMVSPPMLTPYADSHLAGVACPMKLPKSQVYVAGDRLHSRLAYGIQAALRAASGPFT